MLDRAVNLKDNENPYPVNIKNAFTTISNDMTKEIDYFVRSVESAFDIGYINENLDVKRTITFSNLVERIDLGKG